MPLWNFFMKLKFLKLELHVKLKYQNNGIL